MKGIKASHLNCFYLNLLYTLCHDQIGGNWCENDSKLCEPAGFTFFEWGSSNLFKSPFLIRTGRSFQQACNLSFAIVNKGG